MTDVSQDVVPTPEQVAQERQIAEAAFATASDDTPVKAEPEVVEVKAVEPEPVKEVVDPWKDVPQVVREKLEGIDRLGNDMKAGIGRIAAMQSELAAAKVAASKMNNSPTQGQIAAAATSPETWEKLKEMFKDWSEEFNAADAIDERITGRFAAERAELAKTTPNVDALMNKARSLARIDSKHPNWEADIYAPEGGFAPDFAAWRTTQPPEVQALGASDKPGDSIKMLDMYYDHRKTVAEKQKKDQRLESAIPAKGTPGQRQPTSSDRDAAEAAFASA